MAASSAKRAVPPTTDDTIARVIVFMAEVGRMGFFDMDDMSLKLLREKRAYVDALVEEYANLASDFHVGEYREAYTALRSATRHLPAVSEMLGEYVRLREEGEKNSERRTQLARNVVECMGGDYEELF